MKMADIVTVKKGRKPSEILHEALPGYRRLIQIDDLRPDAVSKYCPPSSGEVYAEPTDVVIAWDGANAGTSSFGLNGVLGSTLAALHPIRSDVDTRYLGHFVRSKTKFLRENCKGATVPHIDGRVLATLDVPLPPVPEQRRIVEILDQADALRVKRRAGLAGLDTLKQSTFLDMFGDPVSNNRGWPTTTVDQICDLVRGSSPRPQGDPRFFGGPVPRLMIADITRDGWRVTPQIDTLTVDGARRSRPVPKGTVVMAVSGNVGLVAQLAIDACIHDGFVGFTNLRSDLMSPTFLLALLHVVKATVHENNKAGAIFVNVTTTDIKAMRLICPPTQLQDQFVRCLREVDGLTQLHQQSGEKLSALFASLQHRAFQGEL